MPDYGAHAATPITFDRARPASTGSTSDMLIPDPTNGTILSFTLVDPNGS